MADPARQSLLTSARRLRLIALQTVGEALRLRLAWLLAAAGLLLVLMARWLQDFNFGATELKFVADFGLGAIGLLGTLLAALVTAHLFFSEMTDGRLACVLTRPVRRWEYVGGKLLGVMALLALFVTALGLVLAIILAVRGRQLGASFLPLPFFFPACALVWFKLSLVAAMTLLVCSYAGSALFASSAGLLLAGVAHLRPFTAPTGWWAWLRLWPNLGLFDVEWLLAGGRLTAGGLLGLAGYWVVFILLFVGLASYVFKHREL